MPFNKIASKLDITDEKFDLIFIEDLKLASEFHFTPIDIAITAANYLAEISGTKVLDIGSGAGKFCFIGASCTDGHFTGVEIRKSLSDVAINVSKKYQQTNVEFINSNITEIPFKDFDAFYIFNPFQENLFIDDRINDEIPLNKANYEKYTSYVRDQLDSKPDGTRLVTYFSYYHEVPPSYELLSQSFEGKLKFWKKES